MVGYRYLAAILLEVTYGKQITSLDNELVQVADRALEGTDAAGSPGSTLVDFFPICKYFIQWINVSCEGDCSRPGYSQVGTELVPGSGLQAPRDANSPPRRGMEGHGVRYSSVRNGVFLYSSIIHVLLVDGKDRPPARLSRAFSVRS